MSLFAKGIPKRGFSANNFSKASAPSFRAAAISSSAAAAFVAASSYISINAFKGIAEDLSSSKVFTEDSTKATLVIAPDFNASLVSFIVLYIISPFYDLGGGSLPLAPKSSHNVLRSFPLPPLTARYADKLKNACAFFLTLSD